MVSSGRVASEGKREGCVTKDDKLIVEPIRDPIELALHGRKWAKTSIEELERD
jgi:hypothetical protein